MMRLIRHIFQIILMSALLFMAIKLPLYKIPYLQGILLFLILLVLVISPWLIYRRFYKKKKHLFKVILLATLLINTNAFAQMAMVDQWAQTKESPGLYSPSVVGNVKTGNFCGAAEIYHKNTFEAEKNNWKGDAPCYKDVRNRVREKLNTLKDAPSTDYPREEIELAKLKGNYLAFNKTSKWKEWVTEKYGLGTDSESMACAAVLATLCSEYDRRHPDSRAKTVKDIMKEDMGLGENPSKSAGCWPCEMAYIILTVVQTLSAELSDNMREAALDILQILTLLWILYATFLAVIFPSKGATFIKDLMIRMLCVMIAALLLSAKSDTAKSSSLEELYEGAITPIISLGLGLSEGINERLDLTATFADEVYGKVGNPKVNFCKKISVDGSDLTGNNPWTQLLGKVFDFSDKYAKLKPNASATIITPELEVNLLCLTQRLYQQTYPMTAVGQSLISFSFHDGVNKLGMFFQNLAMWTAGILLLCIFTVFSFLVAFKIIDIFLRLGFVLVLMPLFVATWAFPATRDFTKKGFMFLLNIVSDFLALTLAINFIIMMADAGFDAKREKLIEAMMADYSKKYGENLYNVITSDQTYFYLLLLIAVAFIGFSMLKSCTQIVSSLLGISSVKGVDIMSGGATRLIHDTYKNVWKPASDIAKKSKPYQAPQSSASANNGGTDGTGSAAAPRRYFGQRAGNAVNSVSQKTAAAIDKVGVTAGQALSKTGIGAIVGVPLTLASKTASIGVRFTGKVASWGVKATGWSAQKVKNGAVATKRFFSRRNT